MTEPTDENTMKAGTIKWLPAGTIPREVVAFPPVASDAERAEQYRDKIGALLSQITDTMTEAKRHGLTVAFAIGTADAFGRFQIASLEISKKLA